MGWWDDGRGAVDQNGQPGSETKGVCNGTWVAVAVCVHCPLLLVCKVYLCADCI